MHENCETIFLILWPSLVFSTERMIKEEILRTNKDGELVVTISLGYIMHSTEYKLLQLIIEGHIKGKEMLWSTYADFTIVHERVSFKCMHISALCIQVNTINGINSNLYGYT